MRSKEIKEEELVAAFLALSMSRTQRHFNSRLELQTLEDRRLHLCHQFARKCLESERYNEWFPLNPKTHSICAWGTHTNSMSVSAIPTGTGTVPSHFLQVFWTTYNFIVIHPWTIIFWLMQLSILKPFTNFYYLPGWPSNNMLFMIMCNLSLFFFFSHIFKFSIYFGMI